jgi:hypothetical protein
VKTCCYQVTHRPPDECFPASGLQHGDPSDELLVNNAIRYWKPGGESGAGTDFQAAKPSVRFKGYVVIASTASRITCLILSDDESFTCAAGCLAWNLSEYGAAGLMERRRQFRAAAGEARRPGRSADAPVVPNNGGCARGVGIRAACFGADNRRGRRCSNAAPVAGALGARLFSGRTVRIGDVRCCENLSAGSRLARGAGSALPPPENRLVALRNPVITRFVSFDFVGLSSRDA